MDNERQKRILIVDDSAMIRAAIRRELEGAGYEIEEAFDGLQALVKVSSSQPPFDLITLDVEMPLLNGFETCRKLSETPYNRHYKSSPPPVIFITSKDTMESRKKGFECGAADFILKPFTKGSLLPAVEKVLQPLVPDRGMAAMVVDDSEAARKIVAQCLKTIGMEVFEASNGREAFSIIKEKSGKIDMIITDLLMPEMDGAELTRKVRKELHLEDVPIICLTAVGERSELLALFKAGATDYLVKPFAKEELIARIGVHLERNQLNRRLRLMVDELTQLNHMKDNLLAVCSHDLRSPLNGILGYADLLLKKDNFTTEDREGLAQIRDSGLALLGFVEDILDLSKVRSGAAPLKMQEVSLEKIIRSSIKTLKNMAVSKQQRISFINLGSDDQVSGNPGGLNRVMNNLISNAIKYTPEGGQITISIEPGESGGICVEVADTGIGIPPEKIPFLFDQFTAITRTGTSGEHGTGLGMSIVKEILARHNAAIQVNSRLDKGTAIRIQFESQKSRGIPKPSENREINQPSPVPKSPEPPLLASKPTKPPHPNKGRILLVEDDPMNQKLSMRVLNESGFRVDLANNGKEALEMLVTRNENYDLVLMDRRMPEMDGLDATRQIRKMGLENLPIVGISADTEEKDVQKCNDAGMNICIPKPIRSETITDLFNRLVTHPHAPPALDQLVAKARMDKKDYLKYLKLFHNSAQAYLADLQNHITQKNAPAAADILHSIKGGALSLGLDDIHEISKELEQRARENQLEEIAGKCENLKTAIDRVSGFVLEKS